MVSVLSAFTTKQQKLLSFPFPSLSTHVFYKSLRNSAANRTKPISCFFRVVRKYTMGYQIGSRKFCLTLPSLINFEEVLQSSPPPDLVPPPEIANGYSIHDTTFHLIDTPIILVSCLLKTRSLTQKDFL